jgi:fumarate reductase flavoprotein subunit
LLLTGIKSIHSNEVTMEPRDFDVIVVGGGGAGLTAAIEASRGGATVLLAEAGERLGGSTGLSSGVIYAAGTSVQRKVGIHDTADAMYAYIMTVTQNRAPAALIRRFADESASLIDWLEGIGAVFNPQRLYSGGAEPPGMKRSHVCEGSGGGLIGILEAAVGRAAVDVVRKTRVRELHLTGGGQVGGIRVDGADVRAGAVILACGGFGNNPYLVTKLLPEYTAAAGDWRWYLGHAHSLGDGLLMGERAGATIGGHDTGLFALTHGFARGNEVFHPDWLVFVNREGRRFIREFSPYGLVARTLMDQPGKSCFAIFDEASRRAATPKKEWIGLVDQYWTANRLEELVKQSKVLAAPSVEELARKAGINAEILATTVETYNRDCEAGSDTAFQKDPQALRPILSPPFYAAVIKPATLAGTFAGIRINREAEALNGVDRPIPGLYAAGETAASMGEIYAGGGNAVANALVWGRIAGRNAARWAKTPR